MIEKANRIMRDERGQGLGEYGLLLALIAIGCIGGLGYLATKIVAKLKDTGDAIGDAEIID